MVVGRSTELNYLNTRYDDPGSRIVVVYGQSRMGKSTVINRFTQDKPYDYYKARSASEREQLYLWGAELRKAGIKVLKYPSFTDVFRAMAGKGRLKRVIVIDDFLYLVKNCPSFIPELTDFTHDRQNHGEVMIILCSSAIGWVENNLMDKMPEPEKDRFDFLKIKELTFLELSEALPGFRSAERVEAYAILGGVPGMWPYFDEQLTIAENICRNILAPTAFLHKQGERIVAEDLRETGIYNTILAALAEGSHKLTDLYRHTDFSRAKISVYLKNLIELELVEKVYSYETEGEGNGRKGIYRISNHFVHFYFTYFYPNISALAEMSPTEFYEEYIAPTFKSYVAEYFKLVCAQKLEQWNKKGRLPITYAQSGKWMGEDGTIDIVAKDESGKTLLGLCNWEKPFMTYEDYEWLLFCAEQAGLRPDYVYLYSVGRFDERLSLEAKVKRNIKLIDMDEF